MLRKIHKDKWIFLIPVVLLLISFVLYPSLPNEIPMQFEIDGSASWTLPKTLGIWMMPVLELLLIGMNYKTEKIGQTWVIVILLSLIQIGVFVFALW